jgi:hypothetical protein
MKTDEIVIRLEAWKRRHEALMAQYDALHRLTGAMPDCDLLRPVFDTWTAYTVAVSELVGDTDEWLQWYEFECDMGRRPQEVTNSCGDLTIRVKTLRQIARVIRWGQE